MSEGTLVVTPVGKIGFNRLEEPKAWQDDPALPKKYNVTVFFEGEDAKTLRLQLIEMGKLIPLENGILKVTFNRSEKSGKPRLVGKDKKELAERPAFIAKDTEVKVQFTARTFPMGVSLLLEAVMVVGDMKPSEARSKGVVVSEVINPEFLDIF